MLNPRRKRKEGAAIVESSLAIVMLCLILFGLLQVSFLVMARDVINFSAFASARSLTVGMEEAFVERVGRTASIPTAGPVYQAWGYIQHESLNQDSVGVMWDQALMNSPESDQFWEEIYLIGRYLFIENDSERDTLLNYMNWLSSDTEVKVASSAPGSDEAAVTISQYVPLSFPFARAFFHDAETGQVVRKNERGALDSTAMPLYFMEHSVELENHASLYLIEE